MSRSTFRNLITLLALASGAASLYAQSAVSADGVVESRVGGFRFPDGSLQLSAVANSGEPVQTLATCDLGTDAFVSPVTTLYTVPAGKRLEIEFLNLTAANLTGGQTVLPVLSATLNGVSTDFFFEEITACTTYPALPSPRCTGAAIPVRIYADPETDVNCRVFSTSDSGVSRQLAFTVTGRLVDVAP